MFLSRKLSILLSVFFVIFINSPLFADLVIKECGSDYNSSMNHFGGRFNANNVPNEGAFAALKSDGSIVAWGPTNKGGSGAPTGKGFKQIYSNSRAFAALKSDGSIESWGDRQYGGDFAGWDGNPDAPTDNGYITIVSTLKAFAAIKADGSISSWGSSALGGNGAPTDKGYVGLYSNGNTFAALKADGSIYAWGSESNAPHDSGYVSIAANAKAFAALKSDGSISAWGAPAYGGTGAPGRAGYVSITSSDDGFAALHSDGSIAAWGATNKEISVFDKYTPAPSGNNFKAIFANKNAFAALTNDGAVVTWGKNRFGGKDGAPTDKGYVNIIATTFSFLAMKADGSVASWGGLQRETEGVPLYSGLKSIASSYYAYAGLLADGRVRVWGGSDDSHPETTTYPPNGDGYVALVSNDRAFAALRNDGTIRAWGHDLSAGVGAPEGEGFVSINGVGATTETNCQIGLTGGGVVADTTAPVITLNGAAQISIIKGQSFTDPGATATDDRDGTLTVVTSGSVDTSKAGTYTITYTATDNAGNSASKTRTVIVTLGADTVKPVITLKGASQISINKGQTFTDPGATATDDRDGTLTVVTSGTVDTSKAGTYTITYTATDNAGNSTSINRTVTVVEKSSPGDTQKPVITLTGDAQLTVIKGQSFTDPGATATDDHDGTLTVVTSGSVDTNKAGTYTITYTATDSAGNKATKTRTVIVKAPAAGDTTPPVITLIGPSELTINKGVYYTDPGANATDNLDGDVEVKVTGNIDFSKPGTYTLTYTATDSAGNVATKKRTINIKKLTQNDVEPPVITIKGPAQVELKVGDSYTDQGATAYDAHDGNVVVVVTSNNVNTQKAGIYEIVYSAKDQAGNSKTEFRIVIVREAETPTPETPTPETPTPDTIKPVISLSGGQKVTIEQGKVFTEPGVSATDNQDGAVSVVITGIVDTSKPGLYTITYSARDQAGNEATATRVVEVVAKPETTPPVSTPTDTSKPEISLIGSTQLTIKQGESFIDPGVTAKDDQGSVSIAQTGGVDTSKAGTYVITYTATDDAGNQASISRTVIVTANSLRPDDSKKKGGSLGWLFMSLLGLLLWGRNSLIRTSLHEQ